MSRRYRLTPTPAQELALREHCAHARFVWNLAVEQESWWRWGRGRAPDYYEQKRQLTEARAAFQWLATGSATVQQEALGDFAQAMASFYRGTHGKPTWRKAGRDEGFRITGRNAGRTRRLSRNVGEVRVPKAGWVRFRWSREVTEARSCRVTLDRSGRWHVAFVAVPAVIPGPGTGAVVGIDRGVAVSAALSTGEMLRCPGLRDAERVRLLRLQRKASRQHIRGQSPSNRLKHTRLSMSKVHARQADRRNDWCEKVSTDLAQKFDVIKVEDLKIMNMTRSGKGTTEAPGRAVRQKAALNRKVLGQGWGLLVRRLEQKAPGRVERVNPAYTSQTCNACGHCASGNRESQAAFRCVACGHRANADTNAAKNIAAGHAVNARGGDRCAGPLNREPQLVT